MGAARSCFAFRAALAAATALASSQIANAPAARAADSRPAGFNLELNPKLAHPIPPPGWIADHRDTWPKEHAAYSETCRTAVVVGEIRFMNRVIGYDEYLMKLTDSQAPNPAAAPTTEGLKREALARATMVSLRNDISAADSLTAQLQALPSCDAATAPQAPVAAVPANPVTTATAVSPAPPAPVVAPVPAPATTPVAAPAAASRSATEPSPTAPMAPVSVFAAISAAATMATIEPIVAPAPSRTGSPAPQDTGRLVITFDDRVAALTPAGIRAFAQAVDAARGGKTVQVAIGDCEAGADFSSGSACARRRLSLTRMLAQKGVRDPQFLFAEPR